MLEKAIEIEGLLRIIRDGNPLPETYILLNMKAAELAEQAESLEEKTASVEPEKPTSDFGPTPSGEETTVADFVMEVPETHTTPIPEVIFTMEQSEEMEGSIAHTIEVLSDLGEDDYNMTPEDLALIEEDEIILSFEETSDFPLASPHPESPETATEENHYEQECEPRPELIKDPLDGNTDITSNYASESTEESIAPANGIIMPESEVEAESEQGKEVGLQEPTKPEENEGERNADDKQTSPKRKIMLRASFSLNDRFLYARLLFNGNMKMFDSTLDHIEGMEDYKRIEDYFYNELEWNPEDSNVADFMNILSKNF